MEAYQQAQEAVMRSLAAQAEGEGDEMDADQRFAMQMLRAEQEQVTAQGEGGGDDDEEDIDVDNLDYDALLELGERIGDVATERWQLEAQRWIDALPTETWDAEPNDEDKCAVCYMGFERGQELRVLRCSHKFHTECVDAWLRNKPTCPMCKVSIKPEEPEATHASS